MDVDEDREETDNRPLGDFSSFDYPILTTTTTSTSVQAVDSNVSIFSKPSPFSGAQSNTTTQSPTGQNAIPLVTPVTSVYLNWTENHTPPTNITPANQHENPFDHLYGNLPQASVSKHGLSPAPAITAPAVMRDAPPMTAPETRVSTGASASPFSMSYATIAGIDIPAPHYQDSNAQVKLPTKHHYAH